MYFIQKACIICETKDKKNEFQIRKKLPRKILIVKEASCRSEATCRCGNIKILIKYYLNLKFKLEIGKKVYFWSEVNLLYLRKVFHESNLSRNVTTWVADRSGSMMH